MNLEEPGEPGDRRDVPQMTGLKLFLLVATFASFWRLSRERKMKRRSQSCKFISAWL